MHKPILSSPTQAITLWPFSGLAGEAHVVTKFVWFDAARLPWYVRAVTLALGFCLVAMLGVALWLRPAAKGYGTHTQLGLAPCTLTQIAGIRCPSCGMTTSWAYFVRGRVIQAAKTNSGGTLLAALAALSGPWLIVSGIAGRWFWRRPNEWVAVGMAVAVVVVTMVDWGYRLSSM